MTMRPAPVDLPARWQSALPDVPLDPPLLYSFLPRRWLRIHTLPGGDRVAWTPEQRAEVLHRSQEVLTAVQGDRPQVVVVIVPFGSWGPASELPVFASRPGTPSLIATDFVAGLMAADDPELDDLFMAAADETVTDVVIADPDFRWLLAPYDGGIDIIACDTAQREAMAERLADWVSRHPLGL